MSDENTSNLLVLSFSLLAACSAPASLDRVGAGGEALSSSDAVSPLVAFAASASDGGPILTAAEAASYVAKVPSFDGDTSVDALGILARFEQASAPSAIASVTLALRHHVEGLRISGLHVSGLTLSSCAGSGVLAALDPKGASYTHVTIVYSSDAWQTTHAAELAPSSDGLFRASLPGLDAHANVDYALSLTQYTGEISWLNNPRENRPGVVSHIDFRQAVDLCEPSVSASTPPFARLVRSFALPDSLGGAAFTSSEVDWLVAQTTYEGGPGIDDPDANDPAVAALDAMNAAGITFEGGAYAIARNFLSQMRMRTATSDVVKLVRGPTQNVIAAAPVGAQFMRLYYSTDGWNSPKVTECTPLGRAGLVNCGLGFLPVDTLVSYSAIIRYASGPDQIVRASDGGNLFGKAR